MFKYNVSMPLKAFGCNIDGLETKLINELNYTIFDNFFNNAKYININSLGRISYSNTPYYTNLDKNCILLDEFYFDLFISLASVTNDHIFHKYNVVELIEANNDIFIIDTATQAARINSKFKSNYKMFNYKKLDKNQIIHHFYNIHLDKIRKNKNKEVMKPELGNTIFMYKVSMPIKGYNNDVKELETELVTKLGYKVTLLNPGTDANFININGIAIFYSDKPCYENHEYLNKVLLSEFYPELFFALASIRRGHLIHEYEYIDNKYSPIYAPFCVNKDFICQYADMLTDYKKLTSNEIISHFYAESIKKPETDKKLIGYRLIKNFPFSNMEIGQEFRLIDDWLFEYNSKTKQTTTKRNLKKNNIINDYSHLFEEIFEDVALEIEYIVNSGSASSNSFSVKITKEGVYFETKLIHIKELIKLSNTCQNVLKDMKTSEETWSIIVDKVTIGCKKDVPIKAINSIIEIYNQSFK